MVPAMSAQTRTQDKAVSAATIETKSLEPTVETKAVDAPKPEGVKVVLSHFVSAGYIDGEEHNPGDEVFVSAQVAHDLIGAGAAVKAV